MFGFVRPLRGELKVREWERFQSVYCGLCHTIRRRYGFMQTMMLSYDCTYLALVLDALEPGGGEQCKRRCVMHPFRRRTCAASSDGMIRAAAVSVILCWHKLADTIADDRGAKRLAAKIFRLFLRRGYRKAAAELLDFAVVRARKAEVYRDGAERERLWIKSPQLSQRDEQRERILAGGDADADFVACTDHIICVRRAADMA